MYALSILLATAVTATLYALTSTGRLTLGNRARVLEGLRLTAHVIVWGVLVSAFISLFLPSAWS